MDISVLQTQGTRRPLPKHLRGLEAESIELADSGLIVLCCFISPYAADREMVQRLVPDGEFIEVFVDTPIDECARRDPKGLYAKAKAGKIKSFTGFDAPYEAPANPEIHLQTTGQQAEQLAERLLAKLAELGITR